MKKRYLIEWKDKFSCVDWTPYRTASSINEIRFESLEKAEKKLLKLIEKDLIYHEDCEYRILKIVS